MCICRFYKQFLGLIIALLCAMPVMYAQQAKMVTVSGTITSADDKQPLIGVSIVAGPLQGVTSDVDGGYAITVAGGTVLNFSYLGFLQ